MRIHTTQGVTLVEGLVYFAVLIVLLAALVTMLISMVKTWSAYAGARNLTTSASIALERIAREVRTAQGFDPLESTFNAHPGRLTLTGATTTEFYLDGVTLRIRENSIDAGALTLPGITVENLVFRALDSTISQGVRVELTLSSLVGTTTKSEVFSTFAILRNSY
jgi:Tfp pilus assembly protein PilW